MSQIGTMQISNQDFTRAVPVFEPTDLTKNYVRLMLGGQAGSLPLRMQQPTSWSDNFDDNEIDDILWAYTDRNGGLTTEEIGGILRRSGTTSATNAWSLFFSRHVQPHLFIKTQNGIEEIGLNGKLSAYRTLQVDIRVNEYSGGQAKIVLDTPGSHQVALRKARSGAPWKWQYYFDGHWTDHDIGASNIVVGGGFITAKIVVTSSGYEVFEDGASVGSVDLNVSPTSTQLKLHVQMYDWDQTLSVDEDNLVVTTV